MKTTKIILVLALALGLFVRTIHLGSRPFGFTWDEAALGYNAYSLLKTGRDEHGQAAPIVFKSFGDYKPGLYIYFTVPSVALLGLNEFSTRLPSAVFGLLTLTVIFVLVRQLFPDRPRIANIALFMAALNPWLVHFSRGAWEANLSLFLTCLGVTFFLVYLRHPRSRYLWTCAAAFGLTFWAYQGAKLFTPLLVLALGLIYIKKLHFRSLVGPVLLVVFLVSPIVLGLGTQSGRLKIFSVFSYTRSQDYVRQILLQDQTPGKNWVYYLYHTETLDQLRGVLQRYLNHLSPRFLFDQGDWTNLRHAEYKQGYFYLIDVLALILGLVVLFRSRSTSFRLLASWWLLAPLPAALSRDLVSGVRSLPMAVPLIIIISVGVAEIWKSGYLRWVYTGISLFLVMYFFEFYFLHAPFYAAGEWVSVYRPAVSAIAQNRDRYRHIYFTDQLGQPYIFVLFYLRYDPALFQKQAFYRDDPSGDVGQVTGFGDFTFRPVFWPELRGRTGSLFVGGEYELPEKDLQIPGLDRIADITYPNGSLGLRVVGLP